MHGCDVKDILSAVGLEEKDLFNNPSKPEKSVLVKEYLYRDETNKVLYKVMRYEPKRFVQAKLENDVWKFKMTDVTYVPYNLPNVVKSDIVYFVEGEKDADNLNDLGLVATTTVSGASSFKKRANEYVKWFNGKTVYIIPDNDKPGLQYAEQIKIALEGISKETKILNLANAIKDLNEKQDISDVIQKYGKEKTLKILEELQNYQEIEEKVELTRENVICSETFEKLYKYELEDIESFFKFYNELKSFCISKKITGFDKGYKLYKESKQEKYVYSPNTMIFPELNENVYDSGKYELSNEGCIYEFSPTIGKILVCYHPILPIERYKNLEDGTEKIKLAFYKNYSWNYIIVDKSTISSNQAIVKLSDFGISVTSENAKYLVKYLSEIENINSDKIKTNVSVSRLGWFEDTLAPYDNKFEIDNTKEMPFLNEKFGESGTLEEWADYFRERRKYNTISRIVMAAGVASILLKKIKQTGFTVHVWGETECGKSVCCMVGQSIFGNPSQNDGKGIGINFNLTNVGLEYKLNMYNNIPLFINEMQHLKDAKDYDKLLFLISEGKGRTRSTKMGGLSRENSWNNIVITNGEINIVKDNSNAGAYNRCLSCEITENSYEELTETADFVKEHYGTPIREILKHLYEYDCKAIYDNFFKNLKNEDITNKQKILEAIILLGDKILTDVIFKDGYYLTEADFENKTVKKSTVVIEERAYEFIRDWYVSEKRHFLSESSDDIENQDLKVEIYGREMKHEYLAIIPSVLRKVLQDNGFDFNEILNAWKRKGYIKHEAKRNTLTVQINQSKTKCIVLDMKRDLDETNEIEDVLLPF